MLLVLHRPTIKSGNTTMEKWEEKSKKALPFTMHFLRVVHFLYTAVFSFTQLPTLIRNPPAHTVEEFRPLWSCKQKCSRSSDTEFIGDTENESWTLLWFPFCFLSHSCYYSGELRDYITRELYTSAHPSGPTRIHFYSEKKKVK